MTGSNLLLSSLKEYYENESNFNQLSIVLNNNKISLRVIDWFVTNYSKKFNIQYELYRKNNGDITLCENDDMYYKTLNVFTSYKSQLKSYSKRYFDPFCRRNRIEYSNNHGLIQKTIGQLKRRLKEVIVGFAKRINQEIGRVIEFRCTREIIYQTAIPFSKMEVYL